MDIELLKKSLEKETKARKDAELTLKKKSNELYSVNKRLTEVIKSTNLFPEENPYAVMRFAAHGRVLMYSNKPGQDIISFLDKSSSKVIKEQFKKELIFSFKEAINHQFDMQIDHKTIRFSVVPFQSKGYTNIYAADISDIKATEVRLQNITSALKEAQKVARMGSWELDVSSNKMTWSEELFQLFQVDSEQFTPSYENYINLLHPDDKQNAIDAIEKAVKHKEGYALTQRRKLSKTKQIHLETQGEIGLGKNGEVNRLYGIFIDVTDKIEAQQVKEDFTRKLELKVNERTVELTNSEQKLKNSLLRERELGELKSSFVSTASHQFRTPLAVIQSNAELLEILARTGENKELEKYKKVTGRITREIAKMTELMDEVLILGKLTSGSVHYKPEEIDIVFFCNKLAKYFNYTPINGKVINVITEGKPYNIHLDPKLLNHSLSNLISNALKYSLGENNPELLIHFKPKEVVLSIKDYGIGIPKEELSKLFQPFFRANNVTEIKGTGLGLSIAKEYIEVNKGHIEVESILGEGSCFKIRFKR